MNAPMSASHFDLWMIAGWTMIHFLWLGTLVAVAALLIRWLLSRASASIRYVTALMFLATLATLPVAIATWLVEFPPSVQPEAHDELNASLLQQDANLATATVIDLAPADAPPTNSSVPPLAPNDAAAALVAEPLRAPNPQSPAPSPLSLAVFAINTSVHYLPWLWLIGTPLTFAIAATGLLGTRRLRRASRPIIDGPIAATLKELTASLRITRRVAVAVCDRIAAPVLIGILRPIILLPPAALTGYSPEEIEMVLLHELAHVRRWDNLVNLVQRLVESLLFFHPAVWLVSSWVRRERESCCDALVVTRTDRPHAYAELLVALAAQMPRSVLFHPAASSAMAAGPLRSRIRRILQLDDDPMLVSGKSVVLTLGTLLVIGLLTVLYIPKNGQADESTPQANDSKKSAQQTSEAASQYAHNYAELFGINPAEELSDEDARSMVALFGAVPTVNPMETRTYAIPPQEQKSLEVTLNSFKDGPLRKHIRFQDKWNANHANIEITAPKAAHYGFFEPIIHSLGKFDEIKRAQSAAKASQKNPIEARSASKGTTDTNQDAAQSAAETTDKAKNSSSINGSEQSKGVSRARIAHTQNNLKNLALALLNYEAARHALPPHAIYSADGKPLLSWRVEILPFLDRDNAELYREFHRNEPWDSEHNRKLIARMPDVFKNPKLDDAAEKTNYFAVVGRECVFDGSPQGIKLQQVADGTARTIALVEADADQAVEWTRPEDWQFDRNAPTAHLGALWGDRWHAAWVDGSVRGVFTIEPSDLIGIQFTRAGGETTSLKESAGRDLKLSAGSVGPEGGPAAPEVTPTHSKFPSLEDQKLADLAFKRLGLELEPVDEADLKRVKALGYDGGVKVVSGSAGLNGLESNMIRPGDILVGLHVWPTTNMQDIAKVLQRDDLAELNPLKFYAVRNEQTGLPTAGNSNEATFRDLVHTGRISVQIGGGFGSGKASQLPTVNAPSHSFDSSTTKPRPLVADDDWAPRDVSRPATSTAAPNTTYDIVTTQRTAPDGRPVYEQHTVPRTSAGSVVKNDPLATSDQRSSAPQPTSSPYTIAPTAPPQAPQAARYPTQPQADTPLREPSPSPPLAPAPNSTASTSWRDSRKPTPAESVFVAYDIAAELKDKVLKYFGKSQSEVRTMADDRGRYIVQATQPWHDNFAALLKAAPTWTDPAAAKERATNPVVMKKIGDEDILEWRSVGLSFKRNTEPHPYPAANRTGVAVAAVAPGSPAAWADIRPGDDVLAEIGNFKASTMQEVQSLLKALGEGLQSKKGVRVKLYRRLPNGSTFVDAEFTLGPEDLGAKPAEPQLSKPPAETKPRPAETDKTNFRYDGKTFNAWRSAWKSELSTEKRLDAVKALAAFGANGYGPEAAKAIVEIAGQYDWTSIGGNEATDTLKKACLGAFGYPGTSTVAHPIPQNDALLALLTAVESKNTNDRLFAAWVLPVFASQNKLAAEALAKLSSDADAKVRAHSFQVMNVDSRAPMDRGIPPRIPRELVSNDPQAVRSAIKSLVKDAAWFNSRGVSMEKGPALYYTPELFPLLFAPDESVRREARQALQFIMKANAQQVVEQLLSLLDDDTRRADHIEAIRALAAMGPKASPALDKLTKILSTSDAKMRVASAAAIKMIVGKDQYQKPIADVLGEELGITVVDAGGVWAALPRGDKVDVEVFNKFTEDVIKEQELRFPRDADPPSK